MTCDVLCVTCDVLCVMCDAHQVRHALDIVYTLSGDVLLAVNPWKELPIYSSEAIRMYQRSSSSSSEASKMPPHIFSSASSAMGRLVSCAALFLMRIFSCVYAASAG